MTITVSGNMQEIIRKKRKSLQIRYKRCHVSCDHELIIKKQ